MLGGFPIWQCGAYFIVLCVLSGLQCQLEKDFIIGFGILICLSLCLGSLWALLSYVVEFEFWFSDLWTFYLGKARFLWWNVAPFLDNWLLDLPWVCSWPGADLLGDINTFLLGFKFGHQFGHVLAGTLGLKSTLFLRSILDNSLGFVITLLISFLESTSSWSTELPGFLGTPIDWGCTSWQVLISISTFILHTQLSQPSPLCQYIFCQQQQL